MRGTSVRVLAAVAGLCVASATSLWAPASAAPSLSAPAGDEIDPRLAAHVDAMPRSFSRTGLFRDHVFRPSSPLQRVGAGADASFLSPHEAAAEGPRHAETPKPVFLRSDATLPKGWVVVDDAAVHPESGLVCLGAFVLEQQSRRYDLVGVRTFDDSGRDVGCTYDGGDGRVISFFASFWPEMTVEQHLQGALTAMNSNTPLGKEAAVAIVSVKPEDGKPATKDMEPVLAGAFDIDVDGAPFRTAIWLTKTYGWHVKARATYPRTDEITEALSAVVFSLNHISIRSKNMSKPTIAAVGAEI